MIPGVDVFAGYGLIDWNLAKASGIRFAWIKCQEGNSGKDPSYEKNVQRARAAGVIVGPYHFAYPLNRKVPGKPDSPGRTPLEQAELFYKACNGFGGEIGELSPAIDLEWPPPTEWTKWGLTAQSISEWGRECCEAMTVLWGRLPIIYTYPWWWAAVSAADVSWAARYPLWMAHYTHPGPGVPEQWRKPITPHPWTDWAAWQYSADGSTERVPGIPACPLDRDVIKNEETFTALTGYVDPAAETQPSIPITWETVHPDVPLPDSDPPDPDDAA